MSALVDSIAARVLNGKSIVENEQQDFASGNAMNCQLLLRWLSHPVYVSKQRLAKISGCSLREIEKLISARELPAYFPPGSKRPKYSISDLIQAMERHKTMP